MQQQQQVCELCHCPEHHPLNVLVYWLSGPRTQPCWAHRYCHYPPLTTEFFWEEEVVSLNTIWPQCCHRSLACQCSIINQSSSSTHLSEARVVREIIEDGNAEALTDLTPNSLRYFFNGEGAHLDMVMGKHQDLAAVGDYSMHSQPRFSGAQVKTSEEARNGSFKFQKLTGYGAHMLLILSCTKIVRDNPVRVFITIKGDEAQSLCQNGPHWHCPAIQMTALASNPPGAYTFNTPQGVAIQRVDMSGLLQCLGQHYLWAEQQPQHASGALQTWYSINEPNSPNEIVAYRAWVHLRLLYLQPAGFGLSDPHVDEGHCDHLVEWPDEPGTWYRVETVTFSDRRPHGKESYIAQTRRYGTANHSSDFDYMLAHHQVTPDHHPHLATMPLHTSDFLFIPMYACVDNEKVRICSATCGHEPWTHPGEHDVRGPRTFGQHRITIAEQNINSHPRLPSINLTIGNEEYGRLQYNDEDQLFPTPSPNRESDWARQFRIALPPAVPNGPRHWRDAFALKTAMRQFRL